MRERIELKEVKKGCKYCKKYSWNCGCTLSAERKMRYVGETLYCNKYQERNIKNREDE